MMMPEDIERFCKSYGYRICLDISHSQLACNYFNLSFRDFLNRIGGYAAHLHIVDAQGVDSEGLQIAEGTTDFGMVAEVLNKECPKASFIPEIWQGHKTMVKGFGMRWKPWSNGSRLSQHHCQHGINSMLKNKSIMITGGTGSFGHAFVPMTLANSIQVALSFFLVMR